MRMNIINSLRLSCLLVIFSAIPAMATMPDHSSAPQSIVITADELNKMIQDNASFVLIDARYDELFTSGHIPGAINIPADQVNSGTLAEHAEDMNTKLIFYCSDTHCPASRIGAAKAIGAGYKYVYEFPGGYADWQTHGYDVTKAQLPAAQ